VATGISVALDDNGVAARLNVRVVPAVFLAVPAAARSPPIGYGVMAEEELAERIYTITQTNPASRSDVHGEPPMNIRLKKSPPRYN